MDFKFYLGLAAGLFVGNCIWPFIQGEFVKGALTGAISFVIVMLICLLRRAK
jgi:hypothetical protein